MIHISDADKQKWDSGSAYKRLFLIFPELDLTVDNQDIYGESMSLTEGVFDGNGELSVCGCISNQFTVEMRYPQIVPSDELYPSDGFYPGRIEYTFKNKQIIATMDADESTGIRLFFGYVDSVETVKERNYIKLTCYDALSKYADVNVFDAYDALFAEGLPLPTVKDVRDAIFYELNISQEETTLVNDDIVLSKNESLTELAAIDVIRAICELNGVFGLINRQGWFEYRKLDYFYDVEPYPSDSLFPGADVFPGEISGDNHEYIDVYKSLRFEDYITAPIDRVVVRDGVSDPESGETSSEGNTLLIEGNLLVNGMDSASKIAIAENILSEVDYIEYRPFEGVSRGYPYIEVGDSVSYYSMLDHSLVSFNILHRELKGLQWLEDRYSASGTEYQPEAERQTAETQNEQDITELKEKVEELDEDVSELSRIKQNFIDLVIDSPEGESSETADVGDLVFQGANGEQYKKLYRYESGSWHRVEFIDSGPVLPATSEDGDVFFQNDGSDILAIWQKVNGLWLTMTGGRIVYSTEEHKVGVWINGNDIYERTYILDTLPSGGSMSYPHNIGGFGVIIYTKGIRNTGNVFTDLLCDNEVSVSGTDIILTTNKSQSGTAHITIGYTKPTGGYYTHSQYFSHNTGEILTGWYMSLTKNVDGDCYCCSVVWLETSQNRLHWGSACLSLSQDTAEAVSHRYDDYRVQTGSFTYGTQTWYYSCCIEASYASSTDLDATQPPSRRFYYGNDPASIVDVFTALLDYINS